MKQSDLKIESVLKSHTGGQRVGVNQPAIHVTHVPTGISAICQVERSQIKNRDVAMLMVEYGLAEVGWRDAE